LTGHPEVTYTLSSSEHPIRHNGAKVPYSSLATEVDRKDYTSAGATAHARRRLPGAPPYDPIRPAERSKRWFADSLTGVQWHATNSEEEAFTAALDMLLGQGLVELSPEQMAALLAECKRRCEQEGDARYCILHDTLARVDAWRDEHDEAGGVPAALLADIGGRIAAKLPTVISEPIPAVAAQFATALRDEVYTQLLSSSEWDH
jgi:hypothetical protein